ncbi:MAG TPA: CcmD family protein [Bacillota bacterium]|nr:MAG: hypothetical protein BWY00_01630 [Firmicutes bacterium ADurb.Bin153]HNV34741.1 CcmD family protein [Bacillota bacterium]HPU95903.1 CcmD family protein [Bacillota bacterium]
MEFASKGALWITGAVAVITWAFVFFYMLKVDKDLARAERRRNRGK